MQITQHYYILKLKIVIMCNSSTNYMQLVCNSCTSFVQFRRLAYKSHIQIMTHVFCMLPLYSRICFHLLNCSSQKDNENIRNSIKLTLWSARLSFACIFTNRSNFTDAMPALALIILTIFAILTSALLHSASTEHMSAFWQIRVSIFIKKYKFIFLIREKN